MYTKMKLYIQYTYQYISIINCLAKNWCHLPSCHNITHYHDRAVPQCNYILSHTSLAICRSVTALQRHQFSSDTLLLLLLLQMSWIRVLPPHSCGGTLQKSTSKLLHSSMQTSADHQSRRRHVSRMTAEKGETWSPFLMSEVRSRLEFLVADSSVPVLQPPERSGRQG